MTLGVDKKTISYKINDKQYERKSISLAINKYRLSVVINAANEEIELLWNVCLDFHHPSLSNSKEDK